MMRYIYLGFDAHTFGDLFENGTAFENKRKKISQAWPISWFDAFTFPTVSDVTVINKVKCFISKLFFT